MEAAALRDLDAELAKLPADADAEDDPERVFEVGKRHPFESLRDWFQALYETLLGSSQGPAHGQLHRALRHRQYPQADRRSASRLLIVKNASDQKPAGVWFCA